MKIGITSDCSSSLEYAPFEHNIKITRTTINFADKVYTDGVDLNDKQFYEKLVGSNIIPTTAAPAPSEIIKRIEEWKNEGCTDVIHFPISYGLSKYGENLEAVKEDYVEGINLHVFNTRSGCIVQGYVAHYAEILAAKGYSIEEIFAECEKMVHQDCTYLIANDLKYLVKSGRLTIVKGVIGQLLRIKPVLRLGENGLIVPYAKVRTFQKAIDETIKIVKEATKNAKEVIFITLDALFEKDAILIDKALKEQCKNGVKFLRSCPAPTVGAHIGPGVVGIGYIILDGLKEKDELLK